MIFSEISHYLHFENSDEENTKKNKSINIPQIIQNICPWLKNADYMRVKENP